MYIYIHIYISDYQIDRSHGKLIGTFEELPNWFQKLLTPFYIPTKNASRFQFLYKTFFVFIFLLLFNYSCPYFSPLLFPTLPIPTSHIQSSPNQLYLSMSLCTCPLMTLPLLCLTIPICLPFWSLSVCSLFLHLWLYFACLFVLLII